MDILKIATDWARAEVLSSKFFILFGIMFLAATIGFWQMGKTDIAKAYIVPTLVAGLFLLAVGIGLLSTNQSRLANFPEQYENDSKEFVNSEIVRAEKTMDEYKTIVYRVFPVIIAISALLLLFVKHPTWRAISITMIALLVVILLVDSER